MVEKLKQLWDPDPMTSLIVEVDFHQGQLVATTLGTQFKSETRCEIEYPIHPARFFKAFVAAHYLDNKAETERALRILEGLAPPDIHFPPVHETNIVTAFSPVLEEDIKWTGGVKIDRDTSKTAVRKVYALFRNGHLAQYVWPNLPDDLAESLASPLDYLCSKTWYLGTSDSVIAARAYAGTPTLEPNWVPHPEGTKKLRIPYEGYMDHLQHCFEHRDHIDHTTDLRVGYRKRGLVGPRTNSRREILKILKISPKLPIESTLALSSRFREILMGELGDERTPVKYLAGHDPNNSESILREDHLAIVPLIECGAYADGAIAGIALVSPKSEPSGNPQLILDTLNEIQTFLFPSEGMRVAIAISETESNTRIALESSTWDGYSRVWESATPVAVPRLGKNLTLEQVILKMCDQDGLPKPVRVETNDLSFIRGRVPPASAMRWYRRKDGKTYFHCYVRLTWDHEVQGPLGLGAGRYQGYGWFRRARSGGAS